VGRSSLTVSSTSDLAVDEQLVAQINQNRYETLAARVLGVKGAGIFGHAEDAIFAGLALDTNAPLELWYPQRIYRYGAGREVAAGATTRAGIEVRNSSTDQLFVIEHVNCSAPAACDFALWVGEDTTADFYGTTMLATNLDTRIAGASARDWGSQGAGLATIPAFGKIDHIICAANTPCHFEPGVILGPGGSFIANNLTANTTTRFGITFHTRQAMPSEFA